MIILHPQTRVLSLVLCLSVVGRVMRRSRCIPILLVASVGHALCFTAPRFAQRGLHDSPTAARNSIMTGHRIVRQRRGYGVPIMTASARETTPLVVKETEVKVKPEVVEAKLVEEDKGM